PFVPMVARLFALDIGERARDTLVRVVHRLVDGRTVFGGEAVFLVPDVERRLLERNGIDVLGYDFHDGIHVSAALRLIFSTPAVRITGDTAAQNFAERHVPGLPARCSCSRKPPEPPRTRDLVEPPRGHKILCRGTEPNEHPGGRQDSRTYFRRQNSICENKELQ